MRATKPLHEALLKPGLRLECPAISKEDDQVRIAPMLCTGCGMCAEVCPKEAIVGA